MPQGSWKVGRQSSQQYEAGHLRLGQAEGLTEDLQPPESGAGAAGLPSRDRGVAVPLRVVAVHRPHALQQGFLRQPSPPAATLGEGLPVGTHQLAHLGRPGLPHISLAHVSTMYIPGLHRQKPSFVQTPRRLQAIVAPVGAARARILRSPNHRVKLSSLRTAAS